MKVPFIDIKRYEEGFLDALGAKLAAMSKGAEFIGGAEVTKLEVRLRDILSVSSAVTCANGTDALQIALRALGVGRGDLVLVPNVTFWATFEAVVNVGADPLTVDADITDGGVSVIALKEAINTFRPKAAVIAHLYGWGSQHLEEIRSICRDEGVLLVEDGAQCFGATYKGRPVYEGALISTTSFYPAKVLGAAGDGGAVMTDDQRLSEKVRCLANHGRDTHYSYGEVGWNSRLDSLQAAFLNLSLDHLDARLASRRHAVDFYRQALPELGVTLMNAPADYEENGYCNVCLIDDPGRRSSIEAVLKKEGIGFGNIYPGVLSKQKGAESYLKAHIGGDEGERLCASVLNLPLFPYMTERELERVVDVLAQAVKNSG